MSASYDQGNLKIDFEYILDSMSFDERKSLIKSLAVTPDVIQWVLDFLCGNDPDGWWDGVSPQTRQQFLEKVESTQLGISYLSFYWKPWGELREKLKEIEATREVCRRVHKIIRDYDHPLHKFIYKEFNDDDCSHYVTKLADTQIKSIEKLVVETLNKMRKPDGNI